MARYRFRQSADVHFDVEAPDEAGAWQRAREAVDELDGQALTTLVDGGEAFAWAVGRGNGLRLLARMRDEGLCPVCGERVTLTGSTPDGRRIASCGDAFPHERWTVPDGGWCEACCESLHPGALVMNGDEVQGCDDCGVADDDAAEILQGLGLRVELAGRWSLPVQTTDRYRVVADEEGGVSVEKR